MRIRLYGVLAMLLLACSGAHAQAGDVRELPAAPEMRSAPNVDYALRTATFAGAKVTLIDVHSGLGDWTRPDLHDLPVPPATPSLPAKDALQWFYGSVAGWMAAPAGWQVQRASIGADGNARYTFVAPEGAAGGWVTYSVIPACEACLLDEAQALLPGAGEALGSRHDVPPIRLGQTNPVMSWQSRPDDCTALFRYRSGGLTVHAAVLSSVPIAALDDGKGELALADVYAALPAARATQAQAMGESFRQAFPACRSPNGWPG